MTIAVSSPVPNIMRRFQLFLIKPSHYDEQGYVIQWLYSWMASSSLAALHGLAADADRRQVLGPDIVLDIKIIDETVKRIRIRDILDRLKSHSGLGMVGLVGVQSNQFPRALDIALELRAAGVAVVIGGFHVSGSLAMLPEIPSDLQTALDAGVSLFAGEAEGCLDAVLRDAASGRLKPIYNHVNELTSLETAANPILPRRSMRRMRYATFDAGRGCPYQCSFCVIINVQGRKSRARSPEHFGQIIRDCWLHGVRRFFITDDNFARNKNWESIFDEIIHLREHEKIKLSFAIQADLLCHKIPNFINKAAKAGVDWVFLGFENINPENLREAKKPQNKITEYRKMLLAWRNAGIITVGGYILGFPADTPASIRESIEIVKREIPIDFLEFFCLTPLPGSEDHLRMSKAGRWMDPDMNKYDAEHVVTDHPRMSAREWSSSYRTAWKIYYDRPHIMTILRRARVNGLNFIRVMENVFALSTVVAIERLHPLQGGFLRRKYRLDRRPGHRIEPAWVFYPKYFIETAVKLFRLAGHTAFLWVLAACVYLDPRGRKFTDQALTPVSDEETESLMLFTHTASARQAVEHARKIAFASQ
jgi:radical SAM superfamily enzyme YgiQ (UPF0313 family)